MDTGAVGHVALQGCIRRDRKTCTPDNKVGDQTCCKHVLDLAVRWVVGREDERRLRDGGRIVEVCAEAEAE